MRNLPGLMPLAVQHRKQLHEPKNQQYFENNYDCLPMKLVSSGHWLVVPKLQTKLFEKFVCFKQTCKKLAKTLEVNGTGLATPGFPEAEATSCSLVIGLFTPTAAIRGAGSTG
jgi:hypothetical protein